MVVDEAGNIPRSRDADAVVQHRRGNDGTRSEKHLDHVSLIDEPFSVPRNHLDETCLKLIDCVVTPGLQLFHAARERDRDERAEICAGLAGGYMGRQSIGHIGWLGASWHAGWRGSWFRANTL